MRFEVVLERDMAEKAGWMTFYRQRLPIQILLESNISTVDA